MEVTTFQYPILILEKHLDTFGHVNNATYLELYEEARWDFIEKNGWGLKKIQTTGIGPVILELNLKFKRELKNRKTITVTSKFKEMKNSKVMVLDQQMLLEDGTVASELELQVGVFDLKERALINPTDEWLKAVGVKSLD